MNNLKTELPIDLGEDAGSGAEVKCKNTTNLKLRKSVDFWIKADADSGLFSLRFQMCDESIMDDPVTEVELPDSFSEPDDKDAFVSVKSLFDRDNSGLAEWGTAEWFQRFLEGVTENYLAHRGIFELSEVEGELVLTVTCGSYKSVGKINRDEFMDLVEK